MISPGAYLIFWRSTVFISKANVNCCWKFSHQNCFFSGGRHLIIWQAGWKMQDNMQMLTWPSCWLGTNVTLLIDVLSALRKESNLPKNMVWFSWKPLLKLHKMLRRWQQFHTFYIRALCSLLFIPHILIFNIFSGIHQHSCNNLQENSGWSFWCIKWG